MAMVSISATIARLKNRKGRVAEKALVRVISTCQSFVYFNKNYQFKNYNS